MLTPPPSPLPAVAHLENAGDYFQSQQKHKASIGKRYTLLVLLFPLLLTLYAIPSLRYQSLYLSFSSRTTRYRPSSFNSLSKRAEPIPTVPSPTSSADGIVPTPFPEAFDLSLSWNFTTTSCQNFFLNFTQADQFRRCRPFSFLLGTSSGFTDAESDPKLLNSILWGMCNTPQSENECLDIMKSYGSTLQTQCKTELAQNSLLVKQAAIGFQLYGPMRQAGCLVNDTTNSYCFLEAVANPSPSDIYYYQLPYGNLLPNNTVPSCSTCIKQVLSIYGQTVAHPPSITIAIPHNDTNASTPSTGSQNVGTHNVGTQNVAAESIPLDNTYQEAADLAKQQCGSVYVQQASASTAESSWPPFYQLYISFVLTISFIAII